MSGNEYLAHHGIKGQKWGVRRYQNLDGSLTDEGRRRYGYGSERSRLVTKNTMDRLVTGGKIGSKIGAVVGAASGLAAGASAVAMLGPGAPAVIAAGTYFTSSTISGAISGGLNGLAIGGIVGAAETYKGRQYIERYDEGLAEFERRDLHK